MNDSELIEKLAELEHLQWIEWSKNIASKEKLSPGRVERWSRLWKPYAELTEEEKEQDREWARKVVALLRSGGMNEQRLCRCGRLMIQRKFFQKLVWVCPTCKQYSPNTHECTCSPEVGAGQ